MRKGWVIFLGLLWAGPCWAASTPPIVYDPNTGRQKTYLPGDTIVVESTTNPVLEVGDSTSPSWLTYSQNTISALPGTVIGSGNFALAHFACVDGVACFLELDSSGSSPAGMVYVGYGGTIAAPTALGNAANNGINIWYGYNGASLIRGAVQKVITTQAWTGSAAGTALQFGVAPNNVSGANPVSFMVDVNGGTPGVSLGGLAGVESLRAYHIASTVDYTACRGAATANPATISCIAEGTDSNVNLELAGKGSGAVEVAESHLAFTQAILPLASGCGVGSPVVTAGSTDTRGSVTTGTGATSCTVTFEANGGAGFPTTPFCVSGDNSSTVNASVSSVSATTLVLGLSGAGLSGGVVTWVCLQ